MIPPKQPRTTMIITEKICIIIHWFPDKYIASSKRIKPIENDTMFNKKYHIKMSRHGLPLPWQ